MGITQVESSYIGKETGAEAVRDTEYPPLSFKGGIAVFGPVREIVKDDWGGTLEEVGRLSWSLVCVCRN